MWLTSAPSLRLSVPRWALVSLLLSGWLLCWPVSASAGSFWGAALTGLSSTVTPTPEPSPESSPTTTPPAEPSPSTEPQPTVTVTAEPSLAGMDDPMSGPQVLTAVGLSLGVALLGAIFVQGIGGRHD